MPKLHRKNNGYQGFPDPCSPRGSEDPRPGGPSCRGLKTPAAHGVSRPLSPANHPPCRGLQTPAAHGNLKTRPAGVSRPLQIKQARDTHVTKEMVLLNRRAYVYTTTLYNMLVNMVSATFGYKYHISPGALRAPDCFIFHRVYKISRRCGKPLAE